MDHITEAFYNVMYQYRLAFTPDGVQANLDLWRQQKTPLLELLRRHPNWREQELAVVFDLSEQRQLDRACVDETKFEMLTLAEEAGLTGERLEEFRDALDAATADYATVPDESRLPVIRNRGHIKCDAGMKASRIINRLCAKFGIDQYETERELGHGDTLHTARVKPYNAVFARLADALNPVRISKTGVLSVHPCDFLELYRSIVQSVIARCLGLPNLWKTNTTLTEIRPYWTTVQGSLHYTDYENGYAALSLMKGYGNYGHLEIGSASRCVGCGRLHDRRNSTHCGECEDMCVCKACGSVVPKNSGHFLDGDGFYCAECMQPCSCCGKLLPREALRPVLNRRGRTNQLCPSCEEAELANCRTCAARSCCKDLRGLLFCERSRYTQVELEGQYA